MTQTYKALYTKEPVHIDGKLNDRVWEEAVSYPMNLSKDKTDQGQVLQEKGTVRFAWDRDYFYLAAEFEDSDIIAQGQTDEMLHFNYGDVCELFLKPADQSYYWELYATPAGRKSSFFFPSRGYLGLLGCLEQYTCGLKIGAYIDGTLNCWQDRDRGWTAEMAMPIKDLEAFGDTFGPSHQWLVLVGRYNYSRYLKEKELSMVPQLSLTNFHMHEEYAMIEFVK